MRKSKDRRKMLFVFKPKRKQPRRTTTRLKEKILIQRKKDKQSNLLVKLRRLQGSRKKTKSMMRNFIELTAWEWILETMRL